MILLIYMVIILFCLFLRKVAIRSQKQRIFSFGEAFSLENTIKLQIIIFFKDVIVRLYLFYLSKFMAVIKNYPMRFVLCFIILGFIAPGISYFYFYSYSEDLPKSYSIVSTSTYTIEKFGKLGPISDWISGLIMPFLTLATLLLVYLAYKSQREELSIANKHFIEQNRTLTKQQFENTFFQMISLHHEIVNNIECQYNKEIIKGRRYFEHAYTLLYGHYLKKTGGNSQNKRIFKISNLSMEFTLNCLKQAYHKEFYPANQEYVGHYFRNLYHIFRLIDINSALSKDEKKEYSRLVRAQLSTYELIMLYYNVIVGHGYLKLMPLTRTYNIFQNLNKKSILVEHWRYYSEIELLEKIHIDDDWED